MRISRIMTATAVFLTLAGFTAPQPRYVVTYSVTVADVEQASGQVMMMENGDARVERSDDDGGFAFNATLYPAEEGLVLKTDLWRGDVKIAEPTLRLARGGVAKMAVGQDQQRVVVEIAPAD